MKNIIYLCNMVQNKEKTHIIHRAGEKFFQQIPFLSEITIFFKTNLVSLQKLISFNELQCPGISSEN